MKNIIKQIIQTIFLITFVLAGSVLAETEGGTKNMIILDAEAAGAIALKNNPSSKAIKERLIQAEEIIKQAKADFFPSIDASGSLSKTDYSNVSALRDIDEQYKTEISATWELFSGFSSKLALLSAEDSELSEIEAGNNTRRLLLLSVAQSYTNVQLAVETIKTLEADSLYYKKLLQDAEVKKEAGSGSLSDVLSFQVQLNSARADLIDAEKEHQIALTGFCALLGYQDLQLPKGTVLTSLEDDIYNSAERPVLSELITLALRNRPDLKQLDYTVNQTDKNIGIAKSGYYPTVSLYGTWSGDREDDAGYDGDDFGNTVGVSVAFNIFSGGATKSKVAEARAAKREAAYSLTNQKTTVKEEVTTAYYELDNSIRQLALQKENTELVKRNRDLVESEYKAGNTSLVRLTEAQSDLIKTRSQYFQAAADLRLSQEQIKAYTGTNLNR